MSPLQSKHGHGIFFVAFQPQSIQHKSKVWSYTITLFYFLCVYVFLFHCNKDLFVLWSCTLHVLSFNLCVIILVPLFYVLDLDLDLFFHHLFSNVIFMHVTPMMMSPSMRKTKPNSWKLKLSSLSWLKIVLTPSKSKTFFTFATAFIFRNVKSHVSLCLDDSHGVAWKQQYYLDGFTFAFKTQTMNEIII